MKLCMMSCMMNGYTPVQIADAAIACGMTAVDWITTHNTAPADLRLICDDRNLKIAAHTMLKEKFLLHEPGFLDEFKYSLEDAWTMGAPVLMLPPFPRRPQKSLEDDRKAWTDYYAQALPLAQKAGITLTMESTGYFNSPIITAEEVLEVLHAVPGLKLTLDIGNMATAEDISEAYPKLHEYVVHFHLKDWKIYDSPRPDTTPKRCGKHYADAMIGEGDLDLKSFWNTVDAKDRELYVNLETKDFSGRMTAPESLRKVSDYLREW